MNVEHVPHVTLWKQNSQQSYRLRQTRGMIHQGVGQHQLMGNLKKVSCLNRQSVIVMYIQTTQDKLTESIHVLVLGPLFTTVLSALIVITRTLYSSHDNCDYLRLMKQS